MILLEAKRGMGGWEYGGMGKIKKESVFFSLTHYLIDP
jgi:hypothetical protein